MQADLVRRDMIEGWELPPSPLDGDDIRLVLAELINSSYDLRNVAELCTAAALDCANVKAALTFEVWQTPWTDAKKGALYTLKSRKPAWYRWFWWRYFGWLFDLVFGHKRSGTWLSKPAVDKPGV